MFYMPVTPLVASESSHSIVGPISTFKLLLIFILIIILASVSYSIVRRRSRPATATRFPVASLVLLGLSLILFVGGTIISVTSNDVVGGTVATIGGFIGTYEVRRRHKREGHPDQPLWTSKK